MQNHQSISLTFSGWVRWSIDWCFSEKTWPFDSPWSIWAKKSDGFRVSWTQITEILNYQSWKAIWQLFRFSWVSPNAPLSEMQRVWTDLCSWTIKIDRSWSLKKSQCIKRDVTPSSRSQNSSLEEMPWNQWAGNRASSVRGTALPRWLLTTNR